MGKMLIRLFLCVSIGDFTIDVLYGILIGGSITLVCMIVGRARSKGAHY